MIRTARLILAFIILTALGTVWAVAQDSPTPDHSAGFAGTVTYQVSLAHSNEHLVRVRFEIGAGSSMLDVQLPVWNALYQVRDFSQYVNWVRAKGPSGEPLPIHKLDKTTWRIEKAAGGAVVEYEVFADQPSPFGAQLNAQHAFLNLAEILMYPVNGLKSPVTVQFTDVPSGWRIATALAGTLESGFTADNYDQIVDSPLEIGILQESDFDEGGAHYRVVVDADPTDYDMQKLVGIDHKIAAAETAWMDDRPFHSYLFIYHFPHAPAHFGMEHANSTAIDIGARELAQDPQQLADVTAHEFFHLWNVKRIRPQSLEPIDYTKENYTTSLWFCEGVTTTAANYAMLRAGVLDENRFLRDLAAQIGELEQQPARLTQSVEESSLDVWLEKYNYYRLPQRSVSYYDKGYLLGITLDLLVRESSQGRASLRDIFQWLNQNYARKSRSFPDSDGIREAAEAVSHANLQWFFQKHVAGTVEIPWDDFFKTVGLHLEQRTRSVADPGFFAVRNFGALPSVAWLSPQSEAERAGLSVGDSVLQINGQPAGVNVSQQLEQLHPGDTLTLRIRGRSGEREVHWKMGSRQEVEFELKDVDNISPQQKARRVAWLKGESQPSGDARP